MTNENPGNQGERKPTLGTLVEVINKADSGTRVDMIRLMRVVSDTLPKYYGQAELSWMTLGKMYEAVKNGDVAAYNVARGADPDGKLAQIVGMVYADREHKEQFDLFNKWEMACRAAHPENLGIETN